MGSWGYRPQDNDAAHDLNRHAEKKLSEAIDNLLAETHVGEGYRDGSYEGMWHRVGAVFINLLRGNPVHRTAIAEAYNYLTYLEHLPLNHNFVKSWRQPELFRESIKLHMAVLRAILQKNWRNGTIYPPPNFTKTYNVYMKSLLQKTIAKDGYGKRLGESDPIEETTDARKEPKAFQLD